MADFDLGVEGGVIVTGAGQRRMNLYVRDGRIAIVTPDLHASFEHFDASGLLIMPGMVDAHIHFMDPGDTSREDFSHGSAAAIHAGVTTVIEHTHAAPVRTADEFRHKVDYVASRSRVDYGLAAHAWPGHLDDVPKVWAAGAAFIKVFTCTTHGVPAHEPSDLLELFKVAAAHGSVCLLHCEDESITKAAELRLRASGRNDGGVLPQWRSRESESVAVSVTSELARLTGVAAVIAHVSHANVVEIAKGLPLETCPQYLTLREDEVTKFGSFRKFTPPARARSSIDLEGMWAAVAKGLIAYIGSDHAPSSRDQKMAGSIWDVHFGLPGIDTTLPILLDGANSGRLSYERVVSVYSEAPARIYGLRGKGSLEAGADADIVVIDPHASWTVRDEDVLSKAHWSPYAGRHLRGRAIRTYLRGRLAAQGNEVIAEPGWGRFVPGRGSSPSSPS